jgi:hypothetical protein
MRPERRCNCICLYNFRDMFISPQQNNAIEHDRETRSLQTHERVTEQTHGQELHDRARGDNEFEIPGVMD